MQIEKSLIKDYGTTRKGILVVEDIFRSRGSGLKDKTNATHVREDFIPVPDEILDNYKDICLGVDLLFVTKIPFLVTISRHLYYFTSQPWKP